MRRHGVIPHKHFQTDSKLTEVLNLIDMREHDKARCQWLMHLKEVCAPSNMNLSGKKWDLWEDSSLYTSCSILFRFQMKKVYDICSKLGDNCPLEEMYRDEPNRLASMPHDVSRLEIFLTGMLAFKSFLMLNITHLVGNLHHKENRCQYYVAVA